MLFQPKYDYYGSTTRHATTADIVTNVALFDIENTHMRIEYKKQGTVNMSTVSVCCRIQTLKRAVRCPLGT